MSNTIHSSIEKIDIDRLYTIEREREEVYANPDFQRWCRDMKIGYMVQKRDGIDRANRMMDEWDKQESMLQWMPRWVMDMY